MRCNLALFIFVLALLNLGISNTFLLAQAPSVQQVKFFEERIRPLLVRHCYECHGNKKQKSGLRVDSIAALLKGGDSGQAIVPGKPDESLFLAAVNYEGLEMPPKGKLSPQELDHLATWIKSGAVWPQSNLTPTQNRTLKFTDDQKTFWAFQPIQMPRVPNSNSIWVTNAIDQFVLQKLNDHDLSPSRIASPEKLLRRVYFDITGLAPSSDVVKKFIDDPSEEHYQSIVDALLASPQYGERWARFWLDLVRYAESDGYNSDSYRSGAWHYRDYVIKAFQNDKPYDQFIKEQLAGDELDPKNLEAQIATGYLRHWIYEYNQRDAKSQWAIILNDITDVTGDTFLGMGMSCARCHDHKFDPILQEDYFRLQAFFSPLLPINRVINAPAEKIVEYQQRLLAWEKATKDVRQQIDEMQAAQKKSSRHAQYSKFPLDVRPFLFKSPAERSPYEQQLAYLADLQVDEQITKIKWEDHFKDEKKTQWEELKAKLEKFDELKPLPLEVLPTVTDVSANPPKTFIQDTDQLVQPGILSVIDPEDTVIHQNASLPTTGRRTALANWMTNKENPLTSRIMVNRIWQHYFGKGIVSTPSDFGILGSRPTHPELLDYLALEFTANQWSIKHIHRLILHSSTYRQSAINPMAEKARGSDFDNALLWRANVRRMDAEQIRDSLLAASGELDRKSFGPPVEISKPRRSIYLKVIRNQPNELLMAFDGTDNILSTPERMTTTTPNQALLVLNNDWIVERAKKLAANTEPEDASPETINNAVSQLHLHLFGRPVQDAELTTAREFLAKNEALSANWQDYCHVLLCSNEFFYID